MGLLILDMKVFFFFFFHHSTRGKAFVAPFLGSGVWKLTGLCPTGSGDSHGQKRGKHNGTGHKDMKQVFMVADNEL